MSASHLSKRCSGFLATEKVSNRNTAVALSLRSMNLTSKFCARPWPPPDATLEELRWFLPADRGVKVSAPEDLPCAAKIEIGAQKKELGHKRAQQPQAGGFSPQDRRE